MFNYEEMKNKIILADCMDIMKDIPDKYFELAIVDPPYELERFEKQGALRYKDSSKLKSWNKVPDKNYFNELFRISKNSIVWGANNFVLSPTEYFIIWNKCQTVENYASAEYAWTNCKIPSKVFTYSIHKVMSDRKLEGGKIHPTQKPVALYRWLLQNYAKPNDKIIDTHSGSGSLACACHLEKFDFLAIEKDEDYYKSSVERLDILRSQGVLF